VRVLSGREASIFACLCDTVVAPEPPLPPVAETDAVDAFDRYLVGTPPLNADEQDKCMRPRTTCWRDSSIKCTKAAAAEFDERAREAASGTHAR